jgi:predicted PurR-regulated permease PerM
MSSLLARSFIKGLGSTSASLTVFTIVGGLVYLYSKTVKFIVSTDNQTQTNEMTKNQTQSETQKTTQNQTQTTQSETQKTTQNQTQTENASKNSFASVFDRLT